MLQAREGAQTPGRLRVRLCCWGAGRRLRPLAVQSPCPTEALGPFLARALLVSGNASPSAAAAAPTAFGCDLEGRHGRLRHSRGEPPGACARPVF